MGKLNKEECPINIRTRPMILQNNSKLSSANIIWCMILITFFLWDQITYLLLCFTAFAAIYYWFRNSVVKKNELYITISFTILLIVEVLGSWNCDNWYFVRIIGGTIGVYFFIIYCIAFLDYINIKIAVWCYILFMAFLIYRTISGDLDEDIDNTRGGKLLFICCLALVLFLTILENNTLRKNYSKIWDAIKTDSVIWINIVVVEIIIMAARARAAFFTGIIILLIYYFLKITKPTAKQCRHLFFVVTLLLIVATFCYINIHTFEFYDKINHYSLQYFDKNLDSSRPRLWMNELPRIKENLLFGCGTSEGTVLFGNIKSYHNSYLELLSHNGLIGIFCLFTILYVIWKQISEGVDRNVVKFILAAFIGVLVYNCFETTLLNNKISVGVIEWLLICFGVVISKYNVKKEIT